jgi:glycosyltransferase involved in cell wall biosynthesis
MTKAPPAVTVIIATYNRSEVLPFAIGSVLDQTFEDFELLVVGDGCTDDSAKVVESIGDPRLRWINLASNSGHQSTPNNEGLRQARGEIIAYLGHDDLWLPHHLRCLVAASEQGADLAFGMTRMVDPPGRNGAEFLPAVPYRPGRSLPPSSVVHRRCLVDRVGGWPDYRTLSGDPETALWRRFHEAGYRLVPVPRLVTVKFPAKWRRNVYRERPSHEQAHWLDRMRQEEDFEAVELASMLSRLEARNPIDSRYAALVAMLWHETKRRLGRRLRYRSFLRRKDGGAIEESRAFKGL